MQCGFVFFFFFKQKTAYEMRISDWSSDVCSSDLGSGRRIKGRHGNIHDRARVPAETATCASRPTPSGTRRNPGTAKPLRAAHSNAEIRPCKVRAIAARAASCTTPYSTRHENAL